jgi:tight adherence protein B
MFLYLMIAAIAVGAAGSLYAAAMLLGFGEGNDQIEDRLASLTKNGGRGVAGSGKNAAAEINSLLREEANGAIDQYLKKLQLGTFIEQAGLTWSVSKFVIISVVVGFLAGAACVAFLPGAYKVGALPIGLAFGALPFAYVWFVRKRRLGKFGDQLPQAMDLMSQALRAGQSLPAGIQLVGEQMEAPLGPEFRRSFEEQNLGVGLTDTLLDMADRIPNLDLRFLVTAVVLQRQTGGDLAEILDKIGHLCRERMQIKGQIQALTGEGRISGVVLLALPPVLFGVMLKLNYEYSMLLFNEPMGNQMLAGALVMQVVGAIWINKIITIKV